MWSRKVSLEKTILGTSFLHPVLIAEKIKVRFFLFAEYFGVGQKLGVVHICKRKSSNLKTFEALRTNKRERAVA